MESFETGNGGAGTAAKGVFQKIVNASVCAAQDIIPSDAAKEEGDAT
jgi:hypothetical protein